MRTTFPLHFPDFYAGDPYPAYPFKVTRHPNPHTAFGCDEHSCLGAQLARLEACVFFDELLRHFPRLELVGQVDRMRATMVPGVKRMPVRLGPR